MVQSAYDVKLLEKDFKHIQKNNYPIVIVYNGRDHFVPTITTSEKDFLAWKIHHEFGSLLAATLLISQECDRPGVPAATASSIRAVRDCLQQHLPKISKKGHTKYLTIRSKAVKTHRGPGVNPRTSTVPGTPAFPSDTPQPGPSSSTSATPGESCDPAGAEEEEEESSVKGYKCQHCGVIKARKPDLRGHIWSVHKLGTPIVCNLGNCNNKSFSAESSLKQHIRTQHHGQYKHSCKRCTFHTDNLENLVSHMYQKHKVVAKDKATGKKCISRCVLCGKQFVGKHLLRKHLKDENCIKKKTLKCTHCPRKFKSKEGLKYHDEHFHQGKRSPCPKCGTLLPEKSIRNHMRRHSSQQLLTEAKMHHAKVSSRQRYFAYTSRKLAKRQLEQKTRGTSFVTKSAPPKLRKAKSPTKKPGK